MSRRPAGRPLAYSKVCDLQGDAAPLTPFLAQVDRYPDALAGQHAIRRWEYAMALYAITAWGVQRTYESIPLDGPSTPLDPLQIGDVGGAGSNFWQVLGGLTSLPIVCIDPSLQSPGAQGTATGLQPLASYPMIGHAGTVEAYAAEAPLGQFDILTCISVIEHVEEIRPFFRACHMLLKPGGLLFLTTDYWDADGPDTAHFHWMRQRIYNADLMQKLLGSVRGLGYASFGQADWKYHGPQVYDYSVCSAALVKK